MAPDTQQNVLYTILFLIEHNALALIYTTAIIFVTGHLLWKPTRGKVLILWGCILLLFAFEYSKHILEPLKEQTIQSLITQRKSVRIEFYITKFLTKIVPFALPIFGCILIGIGIFFDTLWKRFQDIYTKLL